MPDQAGSDRIEPGLRHYIELARADLAARRGADPANISTLSAVLKTWPNSGLGCPQPGMQYLQRLVDGSLIELELDGVVYRYHSGGSRTPFLCERPSRRS